MGRPYNKKTIEEAALLAETLASNQHLGDMQWVALFLGIRESSTAFTLALAAYDATADYHGRFDTYVEAWAEAAALIADGWQIGDEVVLLNHVGDDVDENVPQDRAYLLNKLDTSGENVSNNMAFVFHIDGRKTQDGVLPIAEAPMTDEMKSKVNSALEAMTTAPIETERPMNVLAAAGDILGGANVMDENGMEPPPFNFYAQDDDGE